MCNKLIFLSVLTVSTTGAAATVCAKDYLGLDQTPALTRIKTVIENNKQNGFVNQTRGSYFFIVAGPENFKITFFTSGLFDLYGIRKEGSIQFCDRDGQLLAIGLNRTQNIYVGDGRLEFGQRGARESFTRGQMPEKLASLNDVDAVTLATF